MKKTLRVLLLEDSPIDIELIKYELKKAPLQLTFATAKNRTTFLQQLDEFHPDVILSDFTLPQYSGLEALRDAQQIQPAPVFILVTGTLDEETAVECMKTGAHDFILKSALKRLPSAIEEALKKHEQTIEQHHQLQTLSTSASMYKSVFDRLPFPALVFSKEAQQLISLNNTGRQLFPETQDLPTTITQLSSQTLQSLLKQLVTSHTQTFRHDEQTYTLHVQSLSLQDLYSCIMSPLSS
ncbi:MAG TPA: hypothetical protein DCE42_06080 [Myxococcales bacterium]|nr:hypothetical protein [Deltaproteobacteria bacterium]MBU49702.1 hypothetical protein [Deltaproteobacteria bacterium]HAA54302.1 hypothetical protein [Myxococcales bacterium]|tara:strand:+ start:215 stop:931 length:717 start_codon:yes stop_codon:yes gene_type:complete